MKRFALLFKTFTKREYADRFLNGHIRAAPLEEYRATEDGERMDFTDGTDFSPAANIREVAIDGHPIDLVPGSYVYFTPGESTNVLSMSGLLWPEDADTPDEVIDSFREQLRRLALVHRKFGEFTAVVSDAADLGEKMVALGRRKGYSVKGRGVEYVEETSLGLRYVASDPGLRHRDLVFQKRQDFNDEQEFRIALWGALKDGPFFDIGPLKGWITSP
ncbi:MAG: hypothetical protein OXK74_10365, partial [Gemmatimonadota bacterium]|nr:hypothetical protein [Gemmatimonadota bacterium]